MTDYDTRGSGEPADPYTGGPATATQAPPPPPPPDAPTAVGASTPEPPGGRRPGVGIAIALISIGALLLVAQFVPGMAWWGLWPLIIIAVGVVHAVTPGREGWSVYRFFDGLVTVSFGLVFLAITLGVVGWGVWLHILGLWPVLLISVGFDILGKSLRSSWLRVIGSLFIIGALAYAVAVAAGDLEGIGFAGSRATAQSVSIDEPRRQEDAASLSLKAGVAELSMSAGDSLVTLDGTTPFGEPEVTVDRSGSTADVDIVLDDANGAVAWPDATDAEMDLKLSDRVAWDLAVEVGMSTLDADLSDLDVRSLALKPGIAECTVTMGDAPDDGRGTIAVEAGISNVDLRLPEDAEVRVESSGGLSATHVSDALEDIGDGVWETPGYEDARRNGDPVWLVTVDSGIGTFDLTTY